MTNVQLTLNTSKYLVHFAFHLVLFHKYNRFRTQYYNPTRKAGLKRNMKHYSINIIE